MHHSDDQLLLEVKNLRKLFPVRGGILGRARAWVRAVDGVDFRVYKGETLGIVGETGCGKSTTARLILRLIEPDSGEVYLEGKNVLRASAGELKRLRRDMQIVFQDPWSSFNPRMNIEDAITFNLLVHGVPRTEARQRTWEVMTRVGLSPTHFARRYPHELSGGQRQRVNIARALVLNPKLIILDEPISSLDKSVQVQVLNLLQDLREDLGLNYIFISHDLNVVEYLSHRVAVMYLGKIVEIGEADELYQEPLHPYTRALLASAPSMEPEQRGRVPPLQGDPPNPINPPSGCRFRTRCACAMDVCAQAEPPLVEVAKKRWVACHLYPQKATSSPQAG